MSKLDKKIWRMRAQARRFPQVAAVPGWLTRYTTLCKASENPERWNRPVRAV